MSDKKFIVSFDGGGTNTKICVMNIHTKQKKYFTYGSTNYKSIGVEKTAENLVAAFNEICLKFNINKNNDAGIIFGLSGLDAPKDYEIYNTLLEKLDIDKKNYYLCNDSELAFHSVGEVPGLVVISGTGSICYGINFNKEYRCGGWGSPVSDLGSGCWIGIEVLRDLLRYCDGYYRHELIFDRIKNYYNVSEYSSLPFIITNFKNDQIASIAKIVCDFALEGDVYSIKIIEEATTHIAEMAFSVYKKLGFPRGKKIDVVLAGSLFENQIYRKYFSEKFTRLTDNKNIKAFKVATTPVDGGINLGIKKFINPNLNRGYEK